MSAAETLEGFGRIYAGWIAAAVLAQLPRDLAWVRRRGAARGLPVLLGVIPMPRLGRSATAACAVGLAACLSGGALVPEMSGGAFVFAAGLALLFFAQIIELPEVRRKPNSVPLILLIVGTALLVAEPARESVAASALLTVKVLVALIYFSSAVVKLREAGWAWGAGATLRMILLRYHARDDSALALALAQHPRLCRALALCTLGFELTFWLIIPFPILAWVFVPLGLLFHAGTALLLRIHYWIYLVPAYWVFVRT